MTTEEVYESFIIEINDNATTDNVSCDRGRFVRLFNDSQNRFQEGVLDRRFDDEIRYIQKTLKTEEIKKSDTKKDFQLFPLPEDYFDFSTAYGVATKNSCRNQKIVLHEIKSENENYKVEDSNWKPSFYYRESLIRIQDDQIKVFRETDFKFERIIFTYYRYPVQIALIDPEDPEGEFSSINPEFDDKVVNRIIKLAASQFKLNTGDNSFQADAVSAVQKY